ncbi:MAG: type IV pilus modification protein PilV [Pseudomonadota bacterium]
MITKENGFTLLEVLVAIVVLSLGLLGLAGLQAASLRNNQVAYYRSIATQQAQDIADRMRANMAGVIAPADPYTFSGTPAAQDCISGTCSAALMAQSDANLWNSANARLLPGGAGAVCMDSTPDDGTPAAPACDGLGTLRVIKVWWFDKQAVANQRFVTVFTP